MLGIQETNKNPRPGVRAVAERRQVTKVFETYDPHKHARACYLDDAQFLLALTGVRAAKTHTLARRMLRLILFRDLPVSLGKPYHPGAAQRGTALWWKRRPRLHYWVIGETFDLLKEAMRALLDSIPAGLLEHSDVSDNAIWLKPDILIEFKSGQHPERLVAVGLNGMWIDEGARLSSQAWSAYLYSRLADKNGWMQCSTTPLGQDWTYEAIELPAKRGEPGFSFHKWNTSDNNRVPALMKRVELARRLLPPAYFKREYEADREAFVGQIYEFDEATMTHDAVPTNVKFVQFVGCQDWGFTAPGAHIVLGITSNDHRQAHVWALDEIYDSSQYVEEWWVPEVKKRQRKYGRYETVGDPAEPDNIQRFRDAGISCVRHRNNFSGSNYDEHARNIRAGIRHFATLVHQGRFHVIKRRPGAKEGGCPNLIEEMKHYHWDQHKTGPFGGSLIERPAPNQKEHAATAARYGVTYAIQGSAFEFKQAQAA